MNIPAFRNISPRKLILAVVLFCSIVVFFLILLAGGLAVVHEEGAPLEGRTGFYRAVVLVKREIIHHFIPHHHR